MTTCCILDETDSKRFEYLVEPASVNVLARLQLREDEVVVDTDFKRTWGPQSWLDLGENKEASNAVHKLAFDHGFQEFGHGSAQLLEQLVAKDEHYQEHVERDLQNVG